MNAVWDASTLLLLLQKEPGWKELGPRLPDSVMSSVNLSEVAAKLMQSGGSPRMTREVLEGLPIEIEEFTAALFADVDAVPADQAAELREQTRDLGLSLGDRSCLALGLSLGLPILTADRAWLKLDLGVAIDLARPSD